MKLACILFKYFPYGGLQRDFMRIANIALAQGDSVDVYTLEWHGDIPDGMNVEVIELSAMSNHVKYEKFVAAIKPALDAGQYDCVIGFNKMPGLDVYYAADPCYEARIRRIRGFWARWTRRYRHFASYERAVFAEDASTEVLLIAEAEIANFKKFYHTSDARLHLLPPGIARDRLRSTEHNEIAAGLRQELGIAEDEKLMLMVGSGFRTKGLDRTLDAMAALPTRLRDKTHLVVIGKDNVQPFIRMAEKRGLADNMQFFAGRDDIPRFLAGADILIHPAYSENTGTVLLEALAAGVPVLTTDTCGYAHYINEAGGGRVIASPFTQSALNSALDMMLSDARARHQWAEQGHAWAVQADIYDLHQHAYEIIVNTAQNKRGQHRAGSA
jgi:UDP-glucose:(heptosyl)LPS alpha-1,3-glucosyltransferase